MFAARANQENAVYGQQTAAAAKPLNQGVKGFAPKTPGNKAPKTPFKLPLNDENAALRGGKTGGKGKDGLFAEGKSGKVDRSAFVTPAGPRNRAPLGNKTTNAKAAAFQTPAPPTQEKPSANHSSPRMRRAKIKIHEAEPETAEVEEEERDIEYMPPREVPLPDHPDDWPIDRTYPQFEGKNLTRGWYSEFAPQKDDDEDDEFSDFEEKLKRIEELNEKKKQAKKTTAVKKAPMQKTTRDPLASKPAQSLTARGAASALSKKTSGPSFAAPTTAAQARLPTATKMKKAAATTLATGNPRHTAAKAASNSTLGYSKGRSVSASTRKPLAGVHDRDLPLSVADDQPSPAKSSIHELFGQNLRIEDEDADIGLGGATEPRADGIGDDEVFQLDAVDI